MKRNRMKILLLLLLSSFFSHGRAPAVDPVGGISIEEFKKVDPSMDKGFNWEKNIPKADSISDKEDMAIQEKPRKDKTRTVASKSHKNSSQSNHGKWPVFVFIFALISLPLTLWYSLFKGVMKPKPADKLLIENKSSTQNVANFPNKPKHSNKDDLPKAS